MQPESPILEYHPRPPEPHRICGANPVKAVFLRRPEAVLLSFEEWQRLSQVPSFGRLLMAATLETEDLPPRSGALRRIDL